MPTMEGYDLTGVHLRPAQGGNKIVVMQLTFSDYQQVIMQKKATRGIMVAITLSIPSLTHLSPSLT